MTELEGDLAVRPLRWKFLLAFAISIAMIAALSVLVMASGAVGRGTALGAAMGMVFFGMLAVVSGLRAIDPRPMLTLSTTTLTQRPAAFVQVEAKWEDVAYAEIIPNRNQRLLLVHLRNNDEAIEKRWSIISKFERMNVLHYGAPIAIPESLVGASIEDLRQVINERARAALLAGGESQASEALDR